MMMIMMMMISIKRHVYAADLVATGRAFPGPAGVFEGGGIFPSYTTALLCLISCVSYIYMCIHTYTDTYICTCVSWLERVTPYDK